MGRGDEYHIGRPRHHIDLFRVYHPADIGIKQHVLGIHADHGHAEGLRTLRDLRSDTPYTHDHGSLAAQLDRMKACSWSAPHGLIGTPEKVVFHARAVNLHPLHLVGRMQDFRADGAEDGVRVGRLPQQRGFVRGNDPGSRGDALQFVICSGCIPRTTILRVSANAREPHSSIQAAIYLFMESLFFGDWGIASGLKVG